MNDPRLVEICVRLEQSLQARINYLPPEEIYEEYEAVCIAVLDSRWQDFDEGVLEAYLRELLARKRREPGLTPE